jgi:sec-independent protein translocase protein TatB
VFDIGFGEIVVLAVLALFVFGPERLPKVVADGVRTLRGVREMAQNARQQLTEVVDPELQDIDLKGLDPREFVRRTIDEPVSPRAPAKGAPGQSARSSAAGSANPPAAAPGASAWDADAT